MACGCIGLAWCAIQDRNARLAVRRHSLAQSLLRPSILCRDQLVVDYVTSFSGDRVHWQDTLIVRWSFVGSMAPFPHTRHVNTMLKLAPALVTNLRFPQRGEPSVLPIRSFLAATSRVPGKTRPLLTYRHDPLPLGLTGASISMGAQPRHIMVALPVEPSTRPFRDVCRHVMGRCHFDTGKHSHAINGSPIRRWIEAAS